ncbi:MAG: hypothetical protein PVI21_00590 [Candidatus Woesebacteria bacterium]|jgi:hypothetical protein
MNKLSRSQLTQAIIFWALAIPLGYFFILGTISVSLVALVALCFVFLIIRPFRFTVPVAVGLLVAYLVICGLLNLSQPLLSDSWPIYTAIVFLSAALQPLVFIMFLDAVLGIFDRTRHVYDMAAVVCLWGTTLAVTYGSTALITGTVDGLGVMFLIFFVPWMINGFIILAAAIVVSIILHKRKGEKPKLSKGKRKALKTRKNK